MINGFVGGLFSAWILTFFDVDKMIINVLQPFFKTTLTRDHYYVLFGIIGMIAGAIGKQ